MSKKYPFVYLTIALIIGIYLSGDLLSPYFVLTLGLITGMTIIITYYLHLRAGYLIIGFMICGLLIGYIRNQESSIDQFRNQLDQDLYGKIIKVDEKSSGKRVRMKVTHLNDSIIKPFIVLIMSRDSGTRFFTGQSITLKSSIFKPNGARTPGGFNYRKYLSQKGIYYISYPRSDDIIIRQTIPKLNLGSISDHISRTARTHLNKHFSDYSYMPVILGALLGETSELNDETLNLYRSAGIGYFFAVSGLHVGMIFLLFWPLLYFRHLNSLTFFLFPIIALSGTWIFVAASGFTPSANRAAGMISLYVLSFITYRKANQWNIMAIVAFISLLIDPLLIYDIGFQFSYLALCGIFLYHPKLTKLFAFKNKILSKTWSLIALSISAQFALLPLSLYYFNSFSPLFWISSLIAFIFLQLALYLAIIKLCIPFLLSWLHLVLGKSIEALINTLEICIKWLMQFKYSILEFTPDRTELIFAYLFLSCISFRLFNSNSKPRQLILICFMVFVMSTYYEEYKSQKRTELVICSGQSPEIYIQSHDEKYTLNSTDHHFCIRKSSQVDPISDSVSLIILDDDIHYPDETDILVINNNESAKSISSSNPAVSTIITTSKVKYWHEQKLKEWCQSVGISFYSSRNQYIKIKI